MMRDSMTQFKTCYKHNLPENFFIRPDSSQSELKQVCRQCADDFSGIVPAQSIKDSNQEFIQKFESQAYSNKKQMNLIINSIIQIREAQNKKTESLIFEINNQITNQDDLVKKSKAEIFSEESIKKIQEEYITNLKIFQNNARNAFLFYIKNFNYLIKLFEDLDFNILKEQDSQKKIKIEELKQPFVNDQINFPKIINEIQSCGNSLLTQSAGKFDQNCLAIACNRDASIIAAGFLTCSKIYQFQNDQLIEIQELKGHSQTCLQFIKNDSQLISAGSETIFIWQQQNNQQWVEIDKLVESIGYLNQLIINSNEDLIISAGIHQYQWKIVFWKQNNSSKWQSYQQIYCSDGLSSLSLNDSNTKLIVAQNDNKICVFDNDGNQWIIAQQIDVDQYGYRLCFINDSEFVFLPKCSENLHMYSLNNNNQKFAKANQFQIKNGADDFARFPILFIKSKRLLIVKSCNYLSILKIQDDQTSILIQSIQLKEYKMLGSFSYDGQNIITYEIDSKELQIRKLMIME